MPDLLRLYSFFAPRLDFTMKIQRETPSFHDNKYLVPVGRSFSPVPLAVIPARQESIPRRCTGFPIELGMTGWGSLLSDNWGRTSAAVYYSNLPFTVGGKYGEASFVLSVAA